MVWFLDVFCRQWNDVRFSWQHLVEKLARSFLTKWSCQKENLTSLHSVVTSWLNEYKQFHFQLSFSTVIMLRARLKISSYSQPSEVKRLLIAMKGSWTTQQPTMYNQYSRPGVAEFESHQCQGFFLFPLFNLSALEFTQLYPMKWGGVSLHPSEGI